MAGIEGARVNAACTRPDFAPLWRCCDRWGSSQRRAAAGLGAAMVCAAGRGRAHKRQGPPMAGLNQERLARLGGPPLFYFEASS